MNLRPAGWTEAALDGDHSGPAGWTGVVPVRSGRVATAGVGRFARLPVGEQRLHAGQPQHPPEGGAGPDQGDSAAGQLGPPAGAEEPGQPGRVAEADPGDVEDELRVGGEALAQGGAPLADGGEAELADQNGGGRGRGGAAPRGGGGGGAAGSRAV